jgi:BirA family transcriptional regulator, biotin operon repressor / biotin---[acetyl-CoA-carboxylase] ligase
MKIPGVEVRRVARCGSTNSELLEERNPAMPVLLVAGEQTAGRGRRGRRWHSAPGAGLTFSLARRIRRPARELAALSLVAGVAAARALRALGVAPAALKWPNDLVAGGAKLGGILVETRPAGRETLAVFGIGINLHGADELARRLRRAVASLDQFIVPDAEEVMARIVSSLMRALDAFEAEGFEAAKGEWEAMHAHAGQRLKVRLANGRSVTGIAAGLGEDGALSLRTRAGLRSIRSGRIVSARAA